MGRPRRTHCPAGHELTSDNITGGGKHRRCKTCLHIGIRSRRAFEEIAPRNRTVEDDPLYFRKKQLARLYKLTYEEYAALIEAQGGRCAICGGPGKPAKNGKRRDPLCIDHDHATGKVRGLLCHRCNVSLGYIEDRALLNNALRYLGTHG